MLVTTYPEAALSATVALLRPPEKNKLAIRKRGLRIFKKKKASGRIRARSRTCRNKALSKSIANVMRCGSLDPSSKGVYGYLATMADEHGNLCAYLKDLAEELAIDARTLKRCIAALEEVGALGIDRTTRPYTYTTINLTREEPLNEETR